MASFLANAWHMHPVLFVIALLLIAPLIIRWIVAVSAFLVTGVIVDVAYLFGLVVLASRLVIVVAIGIYAGIVIIATKIASFRKIRAKKEEKQYD